MTRRVKWKASPQKSSGNEDNATALDAVAVVDGKEIHRTVTPFGEYILWSEDSDELFSEIAEIFLGRKKLSVEGYFLPYAITEVEDSDLSSNVRIKLTSGDTVLVRG